MYYFGTHDQNKSSAPSARQNNTFGLKNNTFLHPGYRNNTFWFVTVDPWSPPLPCQPEPGGRSLWLTDHIRRATHAPNSAANGHIRPVLAPVVGGPGPRIPGGRRPPWPQPTQPGPPLVGGLHGYNRIAPGGGQAA